MERDEQIQSEESNDGGIVPTPDLWYMSMADAKREVERWEGTDDHVPWELAEEDPALSEEQEEHLTPRNSDAKPEPGNGDARLGPGAVGSIRNGLRIWLRAVTSALFVLFQPPLRSIDEGEQTDQEAHAGEGEAGVAAGIARDEDIELKDSNVGPLALAPDPPLAEGLPHERGETSESVGSVAAGVARGISRLFRFCVGSFVVLVGLAVIFWIDADDAAGWRWIVGLGVIAYGVHIMRGGAFLLIF